MDELSEKLAGILNDPESLNRVRQMAESLLGEDTGQEKKEETSIGEVLSGNDMKTIMTVMSRLKDTGNDVRTQLLVALKPHLSEPRREKVDTAIKILKMIELLPLLKDSGILNL